MKTEDPMKLYEEAMAALRSGAFEESLKGFSLLQRRHPEIDSAYRPLQKTFALAGWVELARKFEPARLALVDLLKARTSELAQNPDDPLLAEDVSNLEKRIQAV